MKVSARYTINEDEAVESMNASFLKILKNLHSLHDLESIGGWVKQIAVRTAIDFYRSKKKYTEHTKLSIDNEHSTAHYTFFNDDFTESNMNSKVIIQKIQELPGTTREVLNLFAIDGFNHKEIAASLDISEEASRWHLHKARKLMTEKLEQLNYTIKRVSYDARK